MFEWFRQDEFIFRKALSSNPWLKKFLLRYCFEEGFIFFNTNEVGRRIDVKKGDNFKVVFLAHLKAKRKELVVKQMKLQSFEYLLYIVIKLKKEIRNQYDVIIPYLLQLDEKDCGVVIDIFTNKFRLTEKQQNILKGGY